MDENNPEDDSDDSGESGVSRVEFDAWLEHLDAQRREAGKRIQEQLRNQRGRYGRRPRR